MPRKKIEDVEVHKYAVLINGETVGHGITFQEAQEIIKEHLYDHMHEKIKLLEEVDFDFEIKLKE